MWAISAFSQPAHGRATQVSWSAQGSQRGLDLGGEQVEVEAAVVGMAERVEAQALPPRLGAAIERAHNHGSTGRSNVQVDGGGEHVCDERGSDAEPDHRPIDGQSADQECGHRIRRVLRNGGWRGAAIDAVEVMLSDRMSGLSNRMLAIEKEVQHLPTADDFAELRNEMTRVGTMVEASKREVESVGKAINRVEDWLIKRAP